MLIQRQDYLNRLESELHNGKIKLLMGIKRSGKTALVQDFCKILKQKGVKEASIVYINFEDENETFLNYKTLLKNVEGRLSDTEKTYIIFDEAQRVEYLYKVLAVLTEKNTEIYLTASTKDIYLENFIGEFSKNINEIKILPLSFAEYLQTTDLEKEKAFERYLLKGGLPATLDLKDSVATDYVKGLYYTLYLNVLNEKGDWAFWLTRILPMHTGHITKLSKFGDGCVKFINHLIDKHAFYKIEVKSLNGNADFSDYGKYYCSDPSMYTMIFGEKLTSIDREKLLETILYLELIRRGYTVYMGKLNDVDIQFVAEKDGKRTYYQVTESIDKKYEYDTFMDAYQKLNDGCDKVLLTLDKQAKQTSDVKIKNLIDFLLEK